MYEPFSTSPAPESSPHRSALQSAAAHLRRGLRRDGTYEGVGEWDVTDHQWRLLHSWARSQGLSLPGGFDPEQEGGREHDVCFDNSSQRWIKFTKPSSAGYTVHVVGGKPVMTPATPLEYLERWRLHNRIFFDDVRLLGLRTEGHSHRIVISQQDWGDNIPSWEEIEETMIQDYLLERLPLSETLGGYDARAYTIKLIGRHTVIFDVRPLNCARSTKGLIVPFDVIPRQYSAKDAEALRRLN